MPNWISNELRCTAAKSILEQMLDAVITSENFDFNNIIPMPKHQPDLSKANPFWGEGNDYDYEEQEAFGNNNWFDWSSTNWGSKWNASSTNLTRPAREGDDAVIWFETPWSPVVNIIIRLSQMFPDVLFRYRYEDPLLQLGSIDVIQNGIYLDTFSLKETPIN